MGISYESQDDMCMKDGINILPNITFTVPTHPITPGKYVAKHNWKNTSQTVNHTVTSGDWVTASFYINFTNVNAGFSWTFFIAVDGTGATMLDIGFTALNGQIEVRDFNGVQKLTVLGIKKDMYYLIDIKFKIENTLTQVQLVINKRRMNLTSLKTDPGNATGKVGVTLNNPVNTGEGIFYSAGMIVIEDNSSGITDDPLSFGQDFLGLWYDSDESTSAPDFDDNLDAGNWNNLQETPRSDTNTGTYNSGSPAKKGVNTCEDGLIRSGPKNDGIVSGWDVIGSVWAGRFKRSSGFAFPPQTVKLRYGQSDDLAVDGTVAAASITLTTTFVNIQIQVSGVPSLTEWMQVGFEVGNPLSSKTVICSELRAFVFFRVKEVLDHQIVRPIKGTLVPLAY